MTLQPEATYVEEDYTGMVINSFAPLLITCYIDFQLCIEGSFGSNFPVSVTLKFTYTEKYPDELPVMEIEDSINLEDEETQALLSILKEQVHNFPIIREK